MCSGSEVLARVLRPRFGEWSTGPGAGVEAQVRRVEHRPRRCCVTQVRVGIGALALMRDMRAFREGSAGPGLVKYPGARTEGAAMQGACTEGARCMH